MKGLFFGLALSLAGASVAQTCCKAPQPTADEQFMMMAQEMEMKAEGKMACCKSTIAKPVVKATGECCNAAGSLAKFKVYVAGEGYKYFGCPDSAAAGRKALMAKGAKVGTVQPVRTRVAI